MSSKMKYVVVDTGLVDAIIVFPDVIQHNQFAMFPGEILSAGFISMNSDGKWSCWGKSVSLGLNSRPEEDSAIANRMLPTS